VSFRIIAEANATKKLRKGEYRVEELRCANVRIGSSRLKMQACIEWRCGEVVG
jgi:hypothetical protein